MVESNSNASLASQGVSRGDFWTLKDNVSRKETGAVKGLKPQLCKGGRRAKRVRLQTDPGANESPTVRVCTICLLRSQDICDMLAAWRRRRLRWQWL